MIDFFSIEICSRFYELVFNNPLFTFELVTKDENGEPYKNDYRYRKWEAKFEGFRIIVKTHLDTNIKIIKIKGSVHKFHSGGANYTDFDLNALKTAINRLNSIFGFDLYDSIIHSVEFGVNIRLPFSCSDTIENILSYKGKSPIKKRFEGNGQLFKFKLSQYVVKAYNKGLQYSKNGFDLPDKDDLMRFEIHVDKMQYLTDKDIKIETLPDLLEIDNLTKLGKLLNYSWENMVVYDFRLNPEKLNPKERNIISQSNKSSYWSELKDQKTPKKYSRRLEKFRSILAVNSESDLHRTISDLISDKWNQLLKSVHKLPVEKNPEMSTYDTNYLKGNNRTIERRFCIVTGIEITHQKDNSKYLSEGTLDLMEYKLPSTYYKLLLTYGPSHPTERVNYYIAHNIRNKYSNKYHNLKKKAVNSLVRTTIFNGDEVISLTPQQIEILFTYKNV